MRKWRRYSIRRRPGLTSALATALVAAVFGLVAKVEADFRYAEREQQRCAASREAAHRLEDGLRTRFELLRQLRESVESQGFTPETFARRVADLQRRFAGFQAINWIDNTGRITTIVPEEGNERALGRALSGDPGVSALMARADRSGDITCTDLRPLFQGGIGFATFLSTVDRNARSGYINGVFRLQDFMEYTLLHDQASSFSYRLSNRAGHTIEVGAGAGIGYVDDCAHMRVGSNRWTLTAGWPEPAPAGSTMLILIAGLATSLLVGAISWIAVVRREELEDQRRTQAAILNGSPDGIWFVDQDGRTQFTNRRFARMVGLTPSELDGKLVPDLDALRAFAPLLRRPRDAAGESSGEQWVHDVTLEEGPTPLRLRCRIRIVRDRRGARCGALLVATDLTERWRLEEQLVESHRMDAIGRLAGGIAHKYNNLLMIVLGSSELISDAALDPRDRRSLEAIRNAGREMSELTGHLQAFGVRRREARTLFSPSHRARTLIRKRRYRALTESGTMGAKVEVFVEDGLPEIRAAAFEFDQALEALLDNALKASPANHAVKLHIRGFEFVTVEGDLSAIAVEIEDRGPGIPEDLRSRVFEPFFTTREVGEGVGLGLTLVRGFTTRQEGRVDIEAVAGGGTRVRMVLPVAPTDTSVPRPRSSIAAAELATSILR